MSHRALRRGRAIALAAAAVLALTTLLATPAWAHVTVHPSTLPAGSGDIELTFRVPNERDDADTVGVQVYLPSDLPLLSVDVLPIPGWTARVDTRALATPIRTSDGPVSRIVTDINWTATAGGIAPGQYEDFSVSTGQAPSQTGAVVFKTLQTYSSSEVVRWIQVASTQDPNPDSPAPVLTLTAPAPPAASTASTSGGSGGSGDGVAVAALVVALVALGGVVGLFAQGRRDRTGRAAPDTAPDQ